MNDAPKDSATAGKDTLETYRLKAEALYKDLEARFPEWKAKAETAGTEAMTRFQQFRDGFNEKRQHFDTYYADAKTQAGDALETLKTKAEGVWEELKTMAAPYLDSASGAKAPDKGSDATGSASSDRTP